MWVELLVDWISLPSLVLLAWVLLYRKAHREFPFFFSYVIVTELSNIVRLVALRAHVKEYFNVYWISDTIIAVFAFLATYELFVKRLFPAFYKIRFFRYLFSAAAVVITVPAVSAALMGHHQEALMTMAQVYMFLRAAVLVFFVALMLMMGRQWDKQEFGIAFGFGLTTSTSLALIAIWAHTSASGFIVDRLSLIAYDIACFVWLYCFWSGGRASVKGPAESLQPEMLREARKWEDVLKDWIIPRNRKN